MIRKNLILLILGLFLFGCNSKQDETVENSLLPTLTVIVPDIDLGGITGVLGSQNIVDSKETVYVWVADFYANEIDGGFFLLEPERFPKVKVEINGQFQLNNLEPGDYVLVVGTEPEIAKPITENGKTKIVSIQANEIIDLGTVTIP